MSTIKEAQEALERLKTFCNSNNGYPYNQYLQSATPRNADLEVIEKTLEDQSESLQKIEQSLNDYNSHIRELPFVPFQKIWLLIKDQIVMADVRYITIHALDRIAIGLIISGLDTCQLEMNYDKNTMFETKGQAEKKLKELKDKE